MIQAHWTMDTYILMLSESTTPTILPYYIDNGLFHAIQFNHG